MAKLLMEDDLNRRLVAMLQADGRMSHAELAERLGVSRPTIIDRVKRLEADGILNGYAARVSPAAVNKPTVAFVAVRYKDNNEAIEQRFIKALEDEPDILEAHTIAGEDALLLKIVADTPAGIAERLRRIRVLGPMVTTRTTGIARSTARRTPPATSMATAVHRGMLMVARR